MFEASHTGDYGDIIYACPLLKAMAKTRGPITLHLVPDHRVRSPQTPQTVEWIRPLLERQTYIDSVRFSSEMVGTDLTRWRNTHRDGENLAFDQLRDCGYHPSWSYYRWLDNERHSDGIGTIFARSPRYHNDKFPWSSLIKKHKLARFIGLVTEWDAFCQQFGRVEYLPVSNAADMADAIRNCRLFIGNQSLPYAIAEGLKVRTIQETFAASADCVFPRANAKYVIGDSVE